MKREPARGRAGFVRCCIEHPDAVYEVWEPARRYYHNLPPNRLGCTECCRFRRV